MVVVPRSHWTQTAEKISQSHRPLGGLPETNQGLLTPIQHLTVPLIKRARLTCLSAATPHRLPRCMCVSESSGLLRSTTNPVNNYQHHRTPGSSQSSPIERIMSWIRRFRDEEERVGTGGTEWKPEVLKAVLQRCRAAQLQISMSMGA